MNTTDPAFTNGLIAGMFIVLAIQIISAVMARLENQ